MELAQTTDLRVTVARVMPDAHVATLVGELDASTAPLLRRRLAPVAERRRSHLIVDLSAVTFADVAARDVLAATGEALRRQGGSLVVATDDPRLRRLLEPELDVQLERTLMEAVERVLARQYA